MQMTKRVSSLVLAIVMLLEILVPQTTMAKKEVKAPSDNLVKVGLINGNSYDSKLMLELNRLTAKSRKKRSADSGTRLFGYFEEGQEPKDEDKLKYHGEVKADLTVKGLDGNAFQWNEVFGKEELHLRFIQTNDETGAETGVERVLNISRADTYTWTDGDGNPAELPLFNNKLEPLTYEVKLDEEVSDRVKLLTARLTKTDNASPTFDLPDNEGRIKYHLTLEIGLQQVASSKFVSEWNTAVEENARPQLEGTMTGSMVTGGSKPKTINFNLPKNNSDEVIVKTNSRRDQNKFLPEFLFKKPTVKLVETDANGLTFDTTKKTVTSGDHKYKYDFTYDVIKGGKLTMTELLPVTFDANGGEFKNFTAPDTKTKIVKEVEYGKDLTDTPVGISKYRETFKGWGIKNAQDELVSVTDAAFKDIKEAKTFYAMWDNNDIVADELEVKESFAEGTQYVNDFLPTLDQLRAVVKIKDGNGDPQALETEDKLEILGDDGNPVAEANLKTYLYGKLKEDPNTGVYKNVTLKAQVTPQNGTPQKVDIKIRVIKNIYEAKTLAEKPYYVPKDYVKVTLDPTTKAQDPQKTYYYVNPKAKVVIPGGDPTGTGEYHFIKWTMKADDAAADVKGEDYILAKRHQFEKASTIKAHYSTDVVPQEGANKPDGVPDNFVKVTFVPTNNGTMEGAKIFWVNPKVKVQIPVKNPKGNIYFTFKEWKMGKQADGEVYKPTTATQFTAQETTITATYTEGDKIIPFNPEDANPMARPEGYVKVTFKAETGLKFKDSKAYYVKKNAQVTLKDIQDDNTKGYPGYEVVKGYKFDKWDPADTTEIKDKDIVVTAKATPLSDVMEKKDGDTKPEGYVEVTFVPTDKATDTATKTFWVNPEKEVTIPVTDPKGATYYTFKEWKMGVNADGAAYKPTVAQKFTTEKTIITATYDKEEDIIAYDPKDPKTKPEGYVRVTFEAGEGLTLSNDKAYFVKKDANITLGNAKLVKPTPAAKTGYEFKEWDKKDDLVLGTEDVVVKALAKPLPDTKEKKDGEQAPTGYIEVKFVAGDNGKLTESNVDIAEKVYYVNPNKYVTLTPPTAIGNTGYEFGAWDKNAEIPTQYTDPVTTITASFNQLKDVIPKTKNNDSEKPAGYKTVTFVVPRENEEKGYIFSGSTKVYYVDPNREVTLIPPLVKVHPGYKFEKWDKNTVKTPKKYTTDTTVNASFTKLDDIISSINGKGNPVPKPDGYVTVIFNKGEHGSLKGVETYYVNPAAKKKIGELKKELKQKVPTVTPDTGYEFTSWSGNDDEVITDESYSYTIMAQYEALPDVIPQKKTDGTDKPKGYITVTFEKGNHGKELTGQAVYYVNPNKAVVLEDKAPKAVPNTGYTFARWDTTIEKAIQYKNGDKITALYNEPGTISKTEVAGYVKVIFNEGASGKLEGTTEYWIKPGVEVNIPAPTVNPNVGYKFDKWDKSLTVTASAGDPTYEITAIYAEEDTIIPKTKTDDSEKPSGYVTVTFTTDGNGSLEGTTTYFVNPNKEADFTQTAENKTKKPNIGYTEKGGTWEPKEFKKTFTQNAEFKFSFVKLENVIPAKENEARPEGYVTLTLIPTDKATEQTKANKSYWVKANTDISITSKPTGKTETINGIEYTYTFKGWTVTRGTIASWDNETVKGKFIQDTEITAQYTMSADWKDLFTPVEPKDNAVTPVGDTPKPEDLIGNPYDPEHPDNKDNLPDGTNITYVTEPKVDKDGKVTAKVKIEYPGGKTTIIEVPVTVVKNVVPQEGGEDGQKPLVPANYVKVTVDTTDKATDNTKFTKVFWVKPGVEVSIPGILDPTGKAVVESGVTKTNKFKQWKLEGNNPEKTYEHGTDIKGTFAAKESKIVAVYEQGKNVDPEPNSGQWIPKGSEPSPKDFIKNPYNDDDPNNPSNLPSGTKIEFDEPKPDTSTEAKDKSVTIKITYPNGEVRKVPITYNVTGDVVEQKDPNTKPAVPDEFVKVIIDKTENAQLAPGENQMQVFWVNPTKSVTIPVNDPTAKDADKVFTGWDESLTQKFTAEETRITAKFSLKQTPIEPLPTAGYVITEEGVQPKPEDYKKAITPPDGKEIESLVIIEKPDVSKPGMKTAKIQVNYTDGTNVQIPVRVFVQRKPQTDWQTGTLGSTRILTVVEKEVVKVPAEKTFRKEVRYMQGFNNYFRPTEGLTRAEAAQILANALVEDGYRYDPNFAIRYKDIVGNEWYAKAIRITSQANVFKGYDTGYFDPHKKITRAEWIGTLRRFQELERAPGNHMQVRPDHWAMGEIEAAYKEGWLAIYGQGLARFNADEFIPRQEVAAVSNKAFNRVLDKTYIHRNSKNLINYKDVNPSMWSYEDILCASNGYLHDGKSFWGHKIDYKKDLYNINLDGYTVRKDKFQRLERR